MLKKVTTSSAIVLISVFSVIASLSLPSEARNRCRGLGQHLDPTMRCQVTDFTAPPPVPSSRPGIAEIQRVHNEVIGGNGGPAYVATAQNMLANGKTLRDVRIFLVNNFSEAAIQRVHREVIGGNGGPAYVATAKGMLSNGKTLQDVREFLIRNFRR